MIGHNQIIEYRKAGKKPSVIFIEFDSQPTPSRFDFNHPERQLDWKCHAVVYVKPDETPDLRFVIDCGVIVQAKSWSEELFTFLDRLTKAKPLRVTVSAMDEDDRLMRWKNNEWEVA